jgi:murein DD-endopeptidase MepM/ murein hydrolase activator NlpD
VAPAPPVAAKTTVVPAAPVGRPAALVTASVAPVSATAGGGIALFTEHPVLADPAPSDRWIHPLYGPRRRMPIHDSRTFGAARPGDRPVECQSGHCGVDLGGEVYKEPVLAVHDGVIDRVQRGPNPDHGGLYVRIAHRAGTVFTQYFHLASIPKRLVAGLPVHVGEVIGYLGSSGVKHSGPHLHFALSVRPSKDGPEQYVDPESLIALWPVSIPQAAGAPLIDELVAPGLPVQRRRGHRHATTVAHAQVAPPALTPGLNPALSDDGSARE